MLRILHCSDLRLGAHLNLQELDNPHEAEQKSKETVSGLVSCVKKYRVSLVLIAGNLLCATDGGEKTLSWVLKEFASAPACRFVIAPGQLDAVSESSPYLHTELPENVVLFCEHQLTRVPFDDIGVDIYGYACHEGDFSDILSDGFRVEDDSRLNLFVGCADMNGNTQALPALSREQLYGAGFSYAAIGGAKNTEGIRRFGSGTHMIYFGYSGVSVARCFDDCGVAGVLVVDLQKEDGQPVTAKVHRMTLAKEETTVPDADEESVDVLRSRITALTEKRQQVEGGSITDDFGKTEHAIADSEAQIKASETRCAELEKTLAEYREYADLDEMDMDACMLKCDARDTLKDEVQEGKEVQQLLPKLQKLYTQVCENESCQESDRRRLRGRKIPIDEVEYSLEKLRSGVGVLTFFMSLFLFLTFLLLSILAFCLLMSASQYALYTGCGIAVTLVASVIFAVLRGRRIGRIHALCMEYECADEDELDEVLSIQKADDSASLSAEEAEREVRYRAAYTEAVKLLKGCGFGEKLSDTDGDPAEIASCIRQVEERVAEITRISEELANLEEQIGTTDYAALQTRHDELAKKFGGVPASEINTETYLRELDFDQKKIAALTSRLKTLHAKEEPQPVKNQAADSYIREKLLGEIDALLAKKHAALKVLQDSN